MRGTAFFVTAVGVVLWASAICPADTITWGGANANWTVATNWVGGAVPKNGDTGVIENGKAQIPSPGTAGGLYDPASETPPAEMLILTGGTLNWLRASGVNAGPYDASYSIPDHNLVLDGGTIEGSDPDYAYYWYDHTIKVKSASTITGPNSRSSRGFKFYGAFSDYDGSNTGMVTKTGAMDLLFYAASPGFSGGWNIQGGDVFAYAAGAYGTGTINVSGTGSVSWLENDSDMPSVVVGSGGKLSFAGTKNYNLAAGKSISVQDGGRISTTAADYTYPVINAPIALAGNVGIDIINRRVRLTFTSDFTNTGATTITRGGNQSEDFGVYLQKADNAYTGNWVLNVKTTTAFEDGALGTGSVAIAAGAALDISKNLTLYNVLSGTGTAGHSGRTLSLQPRYRNATLTPAGVSPGDSPGTLTVSGDLAFLDLVDYDGSSDAYPTLTIQVGDDPANPGTPIADLLAVSGNVTGLDKVDLIVAVSDYTSGQLNGMSFTFLTSANALNPADFRSVSVTGGYTAAAADDGSGNLELQFTPEPATVSLLGLGLLPLLRRRRG